MSAQQKNYMGIDQYGNTFHGLVNPRKDLTQRLCCTHVDKMYADGKDGKVYFNGCIISGHWITLYEVTEVRKVVD